MKKVSLILVGSLVISIALAGCGPKTTSNVVQTSGNTTQQATNLQQNSSTQPKSQNLDWKECKYPKGGFSIQFPGEPKETKLKGVDSEFYTLNQGATKYIVFYTNYGKDNPLLKQPGEEAIINAAINLAESGNKVITESDIVLGNYKGKELILETPDGGKKIAHVYFINTTIYSIMGQIGKNDSIENINFFLNSFKVLENN